jgi:histidinol dehydrogenase
LLVLADEHANPEFVAADLLSQAEHDADSQVVLVTTGINLAKEVSRLLPRLCIQLPRKAIASLALEKSFALLVDTLEEGIRITNAYAPEHLIICVAEPDRYISSICNAGSVFVGAYAPVTAGDYASGTNHTLPTGGSARWSGGVSVESFQKKLTFQRITEEGLRRLAPTLTMLAKAEGLEGHSRTVTVRLNESAEGEK